MLAAGWVLLLAGSKAAGLPQMLQSGNNDIRGTAIDVHRPGMQNGDASPVGPAVDFGDWGMTDPQSPRKRALVTSSVGPVRQYGCGVRQFILIMELKECGYDVDILMDAPLKLEPLHEVFGWLTKTPEKVFHNVGWFNSTEDVNLESYADIFFFGWIWEHRMFQEPQISLLPKLLDLGRRATLMLDDVPTVRCLVESNRYEPKYCSNAVPKLLEQWAGASKRVFTLTESDARTMREVLDLHNIAQPGPIRPWPLRLSLLAKLMAEEGLTSSRIEQRKLLTMVGNDHDLNVDFLSFFFTSGAVHRLCFANVSMTFVGSIGDFVNFARPYLPGLPLRCLATEGVLSGEALQRLVMPKTLAMLNPYFQDVHTGISVKSHEAVAAGLPMVTSVYGFRGLDTCGLTLKGLAIEPEDADNPEAYARFVERSILDVSGYEILVAGFQRLRQECIHMQELLFPMAACMSL